MIESNTTGNESKNVRVWIFNHYATSMFKDRAGRHYWFASSLMRRGYDVSIFCASTVHNSTEYIETGQNQYSSYRVDGVPFIFIKTPGYIGNGFRRIMNMAVFFLNLMKAAPENAELYGRPDIILASSVHPLTLIAGIRIAARYKIPCVCEVRDLWPESLVAYGMLDGTGYLARLLYFGEKWIYQKANRIIFTIEGGNDYIADKGWNLENGGNLDLKKVHYINNGVNIADFEQNRLNFKLDDSDLMDDGIFKVIYTGSIRKVNRVDRLLDTALILHRRNIKDIRFVIWGDGEERQKLEKRAREEHLNNICFKGHIEKKYIPSILTRSDLNVILADANPLFKYGTSPNKMFEYLAAGKPVVFSATTGYSIIKKYDAGIELEKDSPEELADCIVFFKNMQGRDYNLYCENARKAALEYDYEKLTTKLVRIIQDCINDDLSRAGYIKLKRKRCYLKRMIDIILPVLCFLVVCPLLVLIFLAVGVDLGRPVLYKQYRPGFHGKPFKMYKFRTMTNARDNEGVLLPDSERLTGLGRFLRSTSLDELPELFNVLKGDMSLVGPRPLLTQYLERYSEEQARRHEVKPGITGWAQVNGRNAISWEEKFALDVWYVDHWSLVLDMKILLITAWKVISRQGINAEGDATMPEFTGNQREQSDDH